MAGVESKRTFWDLVRRAFSCYHAFQVLQKERGGGDDVHQQEIMTILNAKLENEEPFITDGTKESKDASKKKIDPVAQEISLGICPLRISSLL